MPTVLNVGGGSKSIAIPAYYRGWTHSLLDIDKNTGADIVCDARALADEFQPGSYDAVYCSHNLEHYYSHDGDRVLRGFLHVLKPDGFADIVVPNIAAVMKTAIEKGLDIEDELYMSPLGPIRILDVIYGWQEEIKKSGKDYYAHKTGFTPKSLVRVLRRAGFTTVLLEAPGSKYEIHTLAFKQAPNDFQRSLFGINVSQITA